jgi:hypothetical protein
MVKTQNQLQRGIEKAIRKRVRKLPLKDAPVEAIAHGISKETLGAARLDPGGHAFAPDQFTISVYPGEVTVIDRSTGKVLEQIAADLQRYLNKAGFLISRDFRVTLATDPTLPRGEVRVIAWHSSDPLQALEQADTDPIADSDRPPPGAFVIIQGKRHFELKNPLVRIGRRLNNDLVLDDPHVSRQHAQLIARRGRYLIVDLKSTAGTRVNSRKIEEQILLPGDVIQIAAIELIYGEDLEGPPDLTQPYSPTERPPTARDRVTPLDLRLDPEEDTMKFRNSRD